MKLAIFKSLFISVLILVSIGSYSQTLYPPKYLSPNASSLGTFGEVPVNMFTGTPNISIPIYQLKFGDMKVPISLRYNASAVKPSVQPGWVGSGWDLESIGTITRQQRYTIDEEYIDPTVNGIGSPSNVTYYYPYPTQSVQPGGYYPRITTTTAQLNSLFGTPTTASPIDLTGDVEADEFTFNVMGHSGKFYYAGPALGWQVVSDEHITVQMTEFFNAQDIYNAFLEYKSNFSPVSSTAQIWPDQSRAFGSFTLTVPDGTKFVFGGRTGTGHPDAVEFTSPMPNISSNSQDQVFTANTWLLKSIIDVKGNTINFHYSRQFPTCTRYLSASGYSLQVSNNQTGLSLPCTAGCASPVTDASFKNNLLGIFQWPMYLTQISTPNENVNFYFSPHVYNNYTQAQMSYADQTNPTLSVDLTILGVPPAWPGCLNNIKWEKLDSIVVTDTKVNGTYHYPTRLKKFQFNFLNSSSVPNQRLMLGSLQEMDVVNNLVGQFSFLYNGDLSSANIGATGANIYADGNYSDHWGFYNATNVTNAPVNLFQGRQPNSTYITKELLSQITYPTGGQTKFTWQQKDYSQAIDPTAYQNRNNLSSNVGFGGGCRIFEIQNVLADGTVATDKKYYYKNGYTSGVDPSTLISSGVLNGIPQYIFSASRGGWGGGTVNYNSTSLNSIGNYGYTGQGSPIGYKEVVEVNADGSYTKNYFTNFDADLNGITHWDQVPSGYLGYNLGDVYFPFSSLELERGKLIAQYQYNPNNIPLQKVKFTFRSDANRFNSYINVIDKGVMMGCPSCPTMILLTSARLVFNYSYYPINKTVTTYDQQGNNPIVQSTDYTYNSNNLLQTKTDVGSMGETIVHSYSYPTDYSTTAPYNSMIALNIISPVVKEIVTNSGSAIHTIYKPYNTYSGIYLPQNVQEAVANNPLEIREQVNAYDGHGNILEIQKGNNISEVYLWGYNSQYLVAKITNSTYAAVQSAMTANGITQSQLDQAIFQTPTAINTLLNPLRASLPNALISTYTYIVGIGIATETDPNSRTTTYEYDFFGRLFNVRDQDNNVIKKYCYNYAGVPESCTIVGNAVNIQTYTKSCPPNNTGSTYTYTVPANTYYNYSLLAANQMAAADQLANGQTTANNTGVCTPWPSMSVSLATGGPNPTRILTVTFYQGSTVIKTQTFSANGSMSVPPGTYSSIVVSQVNNVSRTVYLSISGAQTGITVSYSNVTVTGGFFMSVN